MSFAFEKLVVYQKSVDFADAICEVTDAFGRGFGFLADQLNRAALSISSNIAEAKGFKKVDLDDYWLTTDWDDRKKHRRSFDGGRWLNKPSFVTVGMIPRNVNRTARERKTKQGRTELLGSGIEGKNHRLFSIGSNRPGSKGRNIWPNQSKQVIRSVGSRLNLLD